MFCNLLSANDLCKNAVLLFAGNYNTNLLRSNTNPSISKFLSTVFTKGMFPSIFLPHRIYNSTTTLINNKFTKNSSLLLNGLIKFDVSDH